MKKGINLAIMTAIISGISIFANAIFVSKTDPLIFAFMRNAIVAMICSILLISQSKVPVIKGLTKKQWGSLLLIGGIGGGIPFALFFTGLSEIGAVNGNLIQKTLFLWVLVLAIPLLKERVSRIQLFGYIVLLSGMFFFGGSIKILPKTGTWLVLAATILWAIEQIVAKITLRTVSPLIVAWGRMVFGLPYLAVAIAVFGKTGSMASTQLLIPLFVSSMFLTAYMVSWYNALSHAPATLVSSVLVIAPVITAILSLFILGKPLVEGQLLSFSVLMIGIIFVLLGQLKSPRASLYES